MTSLLARVAAGDAAAVRECMNAYGALVWSMARRLLGRSADAEDAVQEIFIDLWRSAGRFDPERGSDVQFVATIARRRLIDRLRRNKRHAGVESIDDDFSDPPAPESTAGDAELGDEAERARAALAQLRPEQQEVLRLAIQKGLTHQEIAAKTGMPLGTVKTHARRGLIRVRELLGVEKEAPR